jgi:outer membrane scaffolding protein for murein synthesis (MipA/OmpV family)
MNKLLFLALAMSCLSSRAETPTANPMPDGSRDMYAGLVVQSAPRYDGAGSRKVSALPTLQVEWSNGIFVSGMSAGMHLSSSPTLEYGPLLAVLPGRSASGTGAGTVGDAGGFGQVEHIPLLYKTIAVDDLSGMDEIGVRVQGGAFLNIYVSPQWRLTSSLLYGSGRDRNGARLELGVQRLAAALGDRHRVALAAGLTAVNRDDNQTYFGVTETEAMNSRFDDYAPGGGLQDVHADLRWNWAWTPSWMLTTHLEAKRLLGSASHSPLVERSSNLTVSTAIVYRF